MKQILIIDESPLFRDYLKDKLQDTEEEVEVSIAINALDGISKIRNIYPDLVIIDYHMSRQGCFDVLQQKKANPNTANIPVIVLAEKIDQKRIIQLVPFNVKKVFTKPIKIDALFATLKEMLGVTFHLDDTPGIVEVHVNDDIMFIEIAQGLNRDKIDLLGFKIIELVNLYEIRVPKLIIMLSDICLNFTDAPNLEKLLTTIINSSKARLHHIRVLTRDDFTRKYIEGRKNFNEIEVVSNLQYAIDGLLSDIDQSMQYGEKKAELIGDKLLTVKDAADGESVALRLNSESRSAPLTMTALKESLQNMHIAVVDDDFVIQELIRNTFKETGALIHSYSNGAEYLASLGGAKFDLIFLDIMMPQVDGFQVLNTLRNRGIQQSIIVLSAVTQRETVIKAFKMGIKSYLIKPLKPDEIFRKSIEILKPHF
ncbi:MAG: response regulator [Treponema sp.]|jgi:DNA-binding response OmpR family regulator|nr:response regulator [Treponema sp.]